MYSDRFRRLCASAGVPTINLHSVRHSLAFWLHQIGVAPADAAALLGHSTEVHLSTYLPHSGAAGIQAAARALGIAAQQRRPCRRDSRHVRALCNAVCNEPVQDKERPHPRDSRMRPFAFVSRGFRPLGSVGLTRFELATP